MNLNEIRNNLERRFKDDTITTLKQLPTPNQLKDMEKSTQRICQAIYNKETINIVGDYDADGVISTTIMVSFFKEALDLDVNYVIPNRFTHGYGLSPKILEDINDGIVITVDNGISAVEAADICKNKGLDLIITDHHTVGDKIPNAFAIINPKQEDCTFPFSDICGANVAWYLCASIKNEMQIEYDLSSLFDILTIAIIADVMPMKSINKTIVKKGFQKLASSSRPALVAIKERFGLISINEMDIGFKIAPLINCAGRMEDGSIALEFLLSNTLQEAKNGLDYLITLNELRKNEQLSIFEDAKRQAGEDHSVIIVSSEEWNEGIIGIVASKLCEKYKKPAFVFKDRGDYLKGSARSLGDIHLYDLIAKVSEFTLNFGGHKGAAGLSVAKKDFSDFIKKINQEAQSIKKLPFLHNEVLASIDLSLVGKEIYELIEYFRPYGLENTLPLFRFENVYIKELKEIGKQKQFQKLVVTNGLVDIDVLDFNKDEHIEENRNISFSASIEKNVFRDTVTYNLLLKEIYR